MLEGGTYVSEKVLVLWQPSGEFLRAEVWGVLSGGGYRIVSYNAENLDERR